MPSSCTWCATAATGIFPPESFPPDMTPILVFDIETIPDAQGLRKLWKLGPEVSDAAVIELVSQRRRQATGSDFMPPHVHRVIAISCALRSNDGVRVWSLGDPGDPERDIVQRF